MSHNIIITFRLNHLGNMKITIIINYKWKTSYLRERTRSAFTSLSPFPNIFTLLSLFVSFQLKISNFRHVVFNATKHIAHRVVKRGSKCLAQMKWCKLWTRALELWKSSWSGMAWPKWTSLFGQVLSNATMTSIQCDLGLENF